MRIVTRSRHILEPDLIGFEFVLPAKGQQYTILRTRAEQPEHLAAGAIVQIGN
jgi:hypothetical protein